MEESLIDSNSFAAAGVRWQRNPFSFSRQFSQVEVFVCWIVVGMLALLDRLQRCVSLSLIGKVLS